MAMMACGVEGKGVVNGVIQCSVNKIRGEQLLSTAESSIDHFYWQTPTRGRLHITKATSPI